MARHLVTFNGENESGYVIIAKIVFPSGKAVEVDDDKLDPVTFGRLQRHPEFTVAVAPKPKAKSDPKPAPAKRRTKAKPAK